MRKLVSSSVKMKNEVGSVVRRARYTKEMKQSTNQAGDKMVN